MEEEEGALGDAGGPSVNDGEGGLGVGEGEGDGVLLREQVDVVDCGVCCFDLDKPIQEIQAGYTHTSTNSDVGLPPRTSRTYWGTFHLFVGSTLPQAGFTGVQALGNSDHEGSRET